MKKFETYIKNYSTRDFIYFWAQKSIEIFNKQMKSSDVNLSCCLMLPFNAIVHGFIHKKVEIMLSAWDIQEMAYLSIAHGNDYRQKTIKENEAATIVNLYRGYENEHAGSEYIKNAELANIFKFIMGMTYEQFKYQNPAWTYQSFNRNYHILIGSENINREKIIDLNKITQEVFGLNVDELLALEFIILWLCTIHPDPLSAPEQLYNKTNFSILNKENLERVIRYYSITYEEVRESSIKQQVFYRKPFVITKKKKEIIAVSLYLVLMTLADGLYWLIRDYYQDHGLGLKFINAFGEMFEDYFEELANIYLPKGAWEKIPEDKKKSADYLIEVDDAVLIFELKSGLLGIGGKQQSPDISQIDKFYDRNIKEAYVQLKTSEKEYLGKKPVIKVFLLYENMTNTQIIMSSLPEIFLNDSRCYIMTIEDLEMLLATYKMDKDRFDEIIRILINNENSLTHYESVLRVLNEYKVVGNMHFVGERDYYEKIIKRLKKELEGI